MAFWHHERPEKEADELLVAKATALWREKKDADAALELCHSAVKRAGARGPAFDLIREIGGLDASRARSFQLLCHGRVTTRFFEEGVDPQSIPKTERGFFTTFRVLADTPEEALEFVQRLEQREWGADFRSLELERLSETRDEVGGSKGIYFRSGRTFYSGSKGKG